VQTAEQLDVYAEEYLALSMERDISIRRAKALMGISHSWIILAEQLRRLAQIEEEENERRAALNHETIRSILDHRSKASFILG
jgi:hypothetical protein